MAKKEFINYAKKYKLRNEDEKEAALETADPKISKTGEFYTKGQQACATYFIIKEFGLDESAVSKSSIARFCHLLVGTPILNENISNSHIYKAYKNFAGTNTSDEKSIKDADFVLERFREIASPDSVQLNSIIKKIIRHKESYYK